MQMHMQSYVVQASRYSMDNGQKGGSVFYLSDPSEPTENRTGQEVIKMSAPYETVDQVRNQLPAECKMTVEIVQGGGNKGSLKLISIEPIKSAQSTK